MTHLQGAWPALMTPHAPDGGPNLTALRVLVRHLLTKEIGGFYVNGTTGEGVFMSVADRKQVLETVLDEVSGQVPVVSHVGAMAAGDAFCLAEHAAACGANGFASIIPPLYNSPAAVEAYYRRLAAAAPDLPFFMYVINASVPILPLVEALLDIPNLAGGKYTGPDMFEFRRVLDAGAGRDAWSLSSGMDEMCVAAVLAGSVGNIGSTLNFMPGAYARMRSLAAEGKTDQAMQLQLKANRVTAIMIDHGFGGALYTVVKHLGIDAGNPRLPNLEQDATDAETMLRSLQQAGFDDLAAM